MWIAFNSNKEHSHRKSVASILLWAVFYIALIACVIGIYPILRYSFDVLSYYLHPAPGTVAMWRFGELNLLLMGVGTFVAFLGIILWAKTVFKLRRRLLDGGKPDRERGKPFAHKILIVVGIIIVIANFTNALEFLKDISVSAQYHELKRPFQAEAYMLFPATPVAMTLLTIQTLFAKKDTKRLLGL